MQRSIMAMRPSSSARRRAGGIFPRSHRPKAHPRGRRAAWSGRTNCAPSRSVIVTEARRSAGNRRLKSGSSINRTRYSIAEISPSFSPASFSSAAPNAPRAAIAATGKPIAYCASSVLRGGRSPAAPLRRKCASRCPLWRRDRRGDRASARPSRPSRVAPSGRSDGA